VLRVAWIAPGSLLEGNAYGYTVATQRTKAALGAHVKFVSPLDAPDLVVHFTSPHTNSFRSEPRTVLITMFETPDLPQVAIDGVRRADALVVPSTFCERIFQRHAPELPVYVNALGVDAFPLVERDPATRVWRWLWVGAMNIRKGWPVIEKAWRHAFASRPDMELYLKTTLPEGHPHAGSVFRSGNCIFDARRLDTSGMQALYASAHAFVFPSLGEGWGMTLAEAMSSGLPCVASNWSGHLDFATDRTAQLLDVQHVRLGIGDAGERNPERHARTRSVADDGKYEWGVVEWQRLIAAMADTMLHYPNALKMGRAAARRVRQFTWEQSGRRLAAILVREARAARRAA
jgi:glycosyltransferase involved in cell wall biosynthesis